MGRGKVPNKEKSELVVVVLHLEPIKPLMKKLKLPLISSNRPQLALVLAYKRRQFHEVLMLLRVIYCVPDDVGGLLASIGPFRALSDQHGRNPGRCDSKLGRE